MASAGQVMTANRGAGPGFDWCRIGLSLAILLFHSSIVVDPHSIEERVWTHPLFSSILAMFFGLSGFLVTGSAIRLKNVWTFLTFRVLRIAPALVVEVTLSAVVLGSLLTTVPRSEYYRSSAFYTYFGNIVGWIHFRLPGVFTQNPIDIVNINLWTLHPEFVCYGVMALLIVSRLVYSRKLMTVAWVVATIGGMAINVGFGRFELGLRFDGAVLAYCFLTGVAAYHWRDRIILDWRLFGAACVAAYILMLVPHTTFLVPALLMYVIIWLGMQRFPRFELIQRGDYSYGIYLYGWPLQQTFILLFPALRHWWIVFPVCTIAVFVVAAVSWHFVEKPALHLKKYVLKSPPPQLMPTGGQSLDAAKSLEAARP